jgi:epsin
VKPRQDENQQLASLFANREGGQDTFGNIGVLRSVICPFLLPRTRINKLFFYRYGAGTASRLMQGQPTGHNPFAMQQQQQQQAEQPFFSI